MKLRPDFEKKCLKAVINDMKREIAFGLDNAKNSEALLEADTWIDIYDKETDEIYSINYSWDWSNDEKEVSVVAYPTEEYKENLKSASSSLGSIVAASGQITETATNMTKAQNDALKLQKELQDLTENLSKLNKIYVGMYDAMHK